MHCVSISGGSLSHILFSTFLNATFSSHLFLWMTVLSTLCEILRTCRHRWTQFIPQVFLWRKKRRFLVLLCPTFEPFLCISIFVILYSILLLLFFRQNGRMKFLKKCSMHL